MATVGTCTTPHLDWESFGEFVAMRRKELRLTQSDLAQEIGRKQPDVSNLEKGSVEPTCETVVRIATALQVEPLHLFAVILKK